MEAFRRAVELAPGDPAALVDLAVEERNAGETAAAETRLRNALALTPDHLQALMQLAEDYWLADRPEESLELCERAIAAHPGAVWPQLHAARALADIGRREEAHARLAAAREMFGGQPELRAREIELLRQEGRCREAHALCRNAPSLRDYFWLWFHKVQLDLT